MMRKMLRCFMGLLLGMVVCGVAVAADNPEAILSRVANNMIQSLAKNAVTLQSDPARVYSLTRQYVLPFVDATEMARRVLPPNVWRNATQSQQTQFTQLFTDTLIHTYASALAQYQGEQIKFYPIRGGYQGKQTVEVNSLITHPNGNPPINVVYRLVVNTHGDWKLYDMSVEGISMLESFREQFTTMGDIATVIKTLQQHNAQAPE